MYIFNMKFIYSYWKSLQQKFVIKIWVSENY